MDLNRNEALLYVSVYEHYKELILSGKLQPGNKMPSLRRCSQELQISRTTVESAYLLLAAEGYIVSKAQSGYYVTDTGSRQDLSRPLSLPKEKPPRFDFSSTGVDRESFRFDIWRRYIKSALRQDERLLSYGEPQGEWDLRQALSDYVKKRRNVLCSPEEIVIGAGVQSLLHILCPLLSPKKTVSFPTPSFVQGISIFQDHGFSVTYRNKDCDIIYVSPARMTKWGDIMPVSRRLELTRYAREKGSVIIEDDYENEFVYLQRPTPSLQSLAGGKGVVYLGSFSHLLLPSIRLSFMVLPKDLAQKYRLVAAHYNQTASKAEQIALCQFIRDGHLFSQARKLKRLYSSKLKSLIGAIHASFGSDVTLWTGAAGVSIVLRLPCPVSGQEFLKAARKKGVKVGLLREEKGQIDLFLSCSYLPAAQFEEGCRLLYEAWTEVIS